MPIVMREGKPCGLNKMSGVMPDSVNGMSSVGHSRDITPFCPWRDENLSPGTGLRLYRSLMEALSHVALDESEASSRTSSTTAGSDDLCRLTVWRPVLSSTIVHRGSPFSTFIPTCGSPSAPRLGSKRLASPASPSPRLPKLWQRGSPLRRSSLRSMVVVV